MKAKSFVKAISDYRNTFLAANFLSLQPGWRDRKFAAKNVFTPLFGWLLGDLTP